MSTEQNYVGRGISASTPPQAAQNAAKTPSTPDNRPNPLAELKFEPGFLDLSLHLLRRAGAPSELEAILTSLRFYKDHLESLVPTDYIDNFRVVLDSLIKALTELAFERLAEQADLLNTLIEREGGVNRGE